MSEQLPQAERGTQDQEAANLKELSIRLAKGVSQSERTRKADQSDAESVIAFEFKMINL